MLRTLVRRSAAAPKPPLTIYTNPYRTKKIWPPDYKQLTPQEQLRFEKKYKRRVTLACARPRWDKAVKLTQLFTIVCTYWSRLLPVWGRWSEVADVGFYSRGDLYGVLLGDGVLWREV